MRWFRRKHKALTRDEIDGFDEQAYGQSALEAKRVLHDEYGLDSKAAAALLPFIGTQLEAGRQPPEGEPVEDEPPA